MTPLRAGIVGAGLMGHWHAEGIKKAGQHLAAVADVDLAAAARLAARHRGAQAFSEVEQMLAQSALEVLHLCVPLPAHYRLAELAIAAGLHLLIEKPLAPQAGETERLFELAAARQVILCPVHQFLFQDGTRKAAEGLGALGRLVQIQSVFRSAGGGGQPAAQLDAVAAEILPHPLSLMQEFLPAGLAQARWQTARPAPGELYAIGAAAGVGLSINISLHARPTVCALQLCGTEGTIHLDLFHGYAVIEPGAVSRARKIVHPFDFALRSGGAAAFNLGRRVISWQPAYPGLQRLIGAFYQAVQTGSAPPIEPADTLAVARARDQLLSLWAFSED